MSKIKLNLAANLEFLMSSSQDSNTLMKLSDRSGIGYSTIRRMLSGEGNPTLESLVAVARHFRVDLESLLNANMAETHQKLKVNLYGIDLLNEDEMSVVQNLIDTFIRNKSPNQTKKRFSTPEVIEKKRAQDLARIEQLDSVKNK